MHSCARSAPLKEITFVVCYNYRSIAVLIREIFDARVIMGISKLTDLKSQRWGSDIVNSLFISIDMEKNAIDFMKLSKGKCSHFSV